MDLPRPNTHPEARAEFAQVGGKLVFTDIAG